jgi:hypothetical protein
MHAHVHRATFAAATPVLVAMLAAAILTPTVTRADEPPTMYVCRTAATDENSNAKMTAATSTALICRPTTIELKMSSGAMREIGRTSSTPRNLLTGPDISKDLTPQQVNDAYVKFIQETFHIDHTS